MNIELERATLAARPPRVARRVRRPRLTRGLLLTYAFLLGLAAFCLVPFLWVFLASLDPMRVRLTVPSPFSLDNYRDFFANPTLVRNLFNSLVMAVSYDLVLACATLGGYALSRFDFWFRLVLMFGVLMTRIIPATATIASLYPSRSAWAWWTRTRYVRIVAAQQLPLALWLMKGSLDTVPGQLEEAADRRYGTPGQRHPDTVVPLAAPGVGAVALFSFIEAWGDFLTPFILVTSSDAFRCRSGCTPPTRATTGRLGAPDRDVRGVHAADRVSVRRRASRRCGPRP